VTRVVERADELARFTEEPGGITRGYGTDALVGAREAVVVWMRDAGLAVKQDAVGNLYGRRGRAGEPAFLIGSHIDSVRNAGRYDGPLGVLVALEAVEALEDPRVAIEVVAWIDEEGLRYHASYLGSRVAAGLFDDDELDVTDANGVPLRDAVLAMGGDPAGLATARLDPAVLLGYCEVHIEQGPVLEAEGLPLGVVTSIAGQSRGTIELVGKAGHAGTVPMRSRQDALCAAAEIVLAVEADALLTEGLIATVGRGTIVPNVGNVIPGEVALTFDVRHSDDAVKAAAVARLQERAREVGERRGVTVAWETLQEHAAVPCSPRLVEHLAGAVEAAGVPVRLMPSGAGHDTVSMAHLTEVAMLFVRCRGGISHHPDESVEAPDVEAAVEAIKRFLENEVRDV
jgi:allantoate deiminase